MSTGNKYILVDGKYLLNQDDVSSIGSMHTVQEFCSKSDAPSNATDLTSVTHSESAYHGSTDVSQFAAAGTINLTLSGRDTMYQVSQYSHKHGVQSAMSERSVSFAWSKD